MSKLKNLFQFLAGNKNKYKPCILTKKQTDGLLTSEIIEMYEPAIKNPGVIIPLVETRAMKTLISIEDTAKLKQSLRYVWCDGFESAVWEPRNCKYLGIRLTDGLILHESKDYTWGEYIIKFRDKCQARFLQKHELMLLNLVWDEVSSMRKKAEDVPLPTVQAPYWIETPENKMYRYNFASRSGELLSHSTESYAHLLLAVIN